jgi:hypothetical protein
VETGIDVEIVDLARPLKPAGKVWTIGQISPRPASQPALTADRIIAAARKTAPRKLASATDGLIAATKLYSARILEDPRSRSARRAMRNLAADEWIIQLCNIEAMEQVHRWKAGYKPDYMIAYATTDLKLSGHEVQADGGAFHSRRDWYGIRFRCDVSPDDSKVVSFAFLVGPPIARSQWASHNLTPDTASDD